MPVPGFLPITDLYPTTGNIHSYNMDSTCGSPQEKKKMGAEPEISGFKEILDTTTYNETQILISASVS